MAKDIVSKKAEAPTPWRPFMEIDRWDREARRMMDDFFRRPLTPWWPERWLRGAAQIGEPAVDVYYDKEELVIKAELPGMDKEDVEVHLADHMLTLKGNKKREETIAEDDYVCSERAYGSFSRTLELPAEVQGEKVKASFKNGVVEIRLPVAETAKPKTIKVKIEDGPITSTGQN